MTDDPLQQLRDRYSALWQRNRKPDHTGIINTDIWICLGIIFAKLEALEIALRELSGGYPCPLAKAAIDKGMEELDEELTEIAIQVDKLLPVAA